MLTDRALASMRCAAAVAHAVPSVRLRVAGGGRTLIEVSRPPGPDAGDEGSPRTMGTCAFRAAVVQAHEHRREGRLLHFTGLEAGLDPSVSYGVRPSTDVVLTGGMLRLQHQARWLHLLPLTGDHDALDALVVEPYDGNGFEVGLAIHHDAELGVAILHVATEIGDHERSAAAIDALTSAAALQAIAEFESHLSPGAASGSSGRALDPAARDPHRR